MWRTFDYFIIPVDHGSAFPSLSSVIRPGLDLRLRNGNSDAGCRALVDTGADFCLFPKELVLKLGLSVAEAKVIPDLSGYGGNCGPVQFWNIQMDFGDGFTISTPVGFADSDSLPYGGFGILGQRGFFSEVEQVNFNHKDRALTIKTSP